MSQNPFAENPGSDNPFAENSNAANPYLAPHQPYHQPGQPPTAAMRTRALAKVSGPAILMQVYGVLMALGSAALVSIPFFDPDDPDRIVVLAVCITGATIGIATGAFTFVTAVWMRRLRGWGWALASVILCFIFALLLCPLFFVLGLWPLIVLLDSEVRVCFDQPAVP